MEQEEDPKHLEFSCAAIFQILHQTNLQRRLEAQSFGSQLLE